jgi:hypothetical protein
VPDVAAFDPQRIVETLARHRVRYVLIGALAARLQGFPRVTADADLTPAPDPANRRSLAEALRELDARIFTEGVPEGLPFDCTGAALGNARTWSLVTSAGRVDILFEPAGTEGYEDLSRGAVRFEMFGVEVLAASLEDILRSKQATGRPQDQQDAVVIREMLRRGTGIR